MPEAVGVWDVVVVGGGNAGFCAAEAAAERGASVLLLEKAPIDEAGGNSYYTAGAFRVAYGHIASIQDVLSNESRAALPHYVVPDYTDTDFLTDMDRITEGRCDPELAKILVGDSTDALRWLDSHGVRWRLMAERQAYKTGKDRWTFFGGLVVGSVGGGKGLMAAHAAAADRAGVVTQYGTAASGLISAPDGHVHGVAVSRSDGSEHRIAARAVVLAAGGFEADPEKRERYLGREWSRALVRGNPRNTGEVLELAVACGAEQYGSWGSCHSVAWDAAAPAGGGERTLTNQLTRQSYPLGIVVNRRGRRFIDEGADYRNYTYAKYGAEILRQPDGIAFQIFDCKTRGQLRTEEYDSTPISEARADNLVDLATSLGIDPDGLVLTVKQFNASIRDRPFNPAIKDGRSADVEPPKSNWSQAIDSPPFYGYAVACGITFTFGGLHIGPNGQVLRANGAPVPGLFAAGEIVGGLFHGNYPGGSGLTAGTVFGRRAGWTAAQEALKQGAGHQVAES